MASLIERNARISLTDSLLTVNVDCASDSDVDLIADGEVRTHAEVILYAKAVRQARAARLRGDIECALACERAAERIYDNIPSAFRW